MEQLQAYDAAKELVVSGASPQTGLQMLRSGRGDGYRAALHALAVDDVIACVVEDPRWDRQVENRDDYYATLLIQLNADVQPIVDYILGSSDQSGESTCWLAIGVLAQMARRGPIVDVLLRRGDQATEQALRSAASQGNPRERAVALHVLGKRGCVDYVDDAKHFLVAQTRESDRSEQAFLRTSYVRYLQAIAPELTLPLARDWLFAPWPLSLAAEKILSVRATLADRGALEGAGKAALAAGEMYRLCSTIEGLAIIGAAESLPFLCEAYAVAPYSFARRRAVTALCRHASHAAVQDLMVESLWDCETETRGLACAAVSRTNLMAARRLKEIAADAFEEPELRDAAASRV